MTLERDLVEIGLAQKEASVYMALVELGTASVQAIAHRAGVVRPTAYVVLEGLAQKGLASKATGPDAKKMLFRAETPERLERFFEDQRRDLERRHEELRRIIPGLRSAFARGEEYPRVRLYEGKDGLQALQQEFVLAGRGPIVSLTPEDDMHTLLPREEFARIRLTRLEAGVPSRHIYTTVSSHRYTKEEDAAALRESRYLPPEKLPLKASFAANGPLLSIVSFRNKIIGVLIEHEDIADSFRAIFEAAWDASEKYQTPS